LHSNIFFIGVSMAVVMRMMIMIMTMIIFLVVVVVVSAWAIKHGEIGQRGPVAC